MSYAICFGCEHARRRRPESSGTTSQMQGLPVCGIDGHAIADHVGSAICPSGFFGVSGALPPLPLPSEDAPLIAISTKPPVLAGDVVESIAKTFGADRAAKFAAKLMGKKDCGCEARKHRLNRLHRRVKKLIA